MIYIACFQWYVKLVMRYDCRECDFTTKHHYFKTFKMCLFQQLDFTLEPPA